MGYQLKWNYPERWFRIHSLPYAKRYAESEEEYQTILQRQNQLITDLIGENTEVWIVYTLFEEDLALEYYQQLKDFKKAQKIGNWIYNSANEYEEPPLNLYVETTEWHQDEKNELLRAIADDTIRAMWVCPSKDILITPYDGGMDIIVPTTQQRDRLKNKYKDWLSHREDGL